MNNLNRLPSLKRKYLSIKSKLHRMIKRTCKELKRESLIVRKRIRRIRMRKLMILKSRLNSKKKRDYGTEK